MNRRIDLHMHSLFSDGELLPSELARRALKLNHEVIAITDHIDYSNVEEIPKIQSAIDDVNENWDITAVLGAEVTHAPIESIDGIAKRAKELGAKIVVVHGETLNEPVTPGTNLAAVKSKYVDILGHPGLITKEEAELALENDIYLEISARKGHCLGNGHVANIAREVGNKLLVNTDTHSPDNLITFEKSYEIARGAGLSDEEAMKAIVDNPRELLKSKGIL
ncbi:MAG: histidinol phosphate phosphatase domain-containing protein [Methanobrevibacter sp.]|uniref:Histidinol phosphate phosphatase domain-containing protein n=1 Tax=Methanobrevibacter millerae TaxID=230361 RepID=A0A8T3VD21_9EURY|nr:histidinol phosphate phosphatase domain-containing protein [Methanobrevibacter millerae]MBE6504186.1 histidinol phosphate phosphatase domain-containing protein [Methanobrevibacter millerae]MBQ6345424.1 histidinol phosphate phosphatase domain-containing protein [Methanobrevibacter sp.]MBR0372189.1 histidinol phosphate phosphatase domain-containing protein [Methanobrevibacter sp.]